MSVRDASAPSRWVGLVVAVYAVALLIYAENWAFTFDEGFHLLAAQLIAAGKRPYIDFCFPQTPLNAFWNAAWMRLLGEHWRVPHLFAAFFTIGAVALTANFVFQRFPDRDWRAPAAITAVLLTGLNAMVFIYGPLGQAYGISLFLLVAACHVSVRAVDRTAPWAAGMVGICAGLAAASSLLTAAAAPVLLAWMLFYHRAGNRVPKFAAFCAGVAIPFAPVMLLAWQGPQQTWFNLIQYHVSFRQLYWRETTSHDVEILTSWIDSGQALLIGLLAVCGLLYIVRRSQWPTAVKAEFYLCAWLAAALSAEAARAHPTFARYFLLSVPFLAILASTGLYAIGSRVLEIGRLPWVFAALTVLMCLGLARSLYDHRYLGDWSGWQRLARKVDEVTLPGVPLFANEPIYFLTRRVPPPGLELSYSHKVDLGPAKNRLMHILTDADVKRQIQSGLFATALSCDDDQIQELGLPDLYRQRADLEDCSIFWNRKK